MYRFGGKGKIPEQSRVQTLRKATKQESSERMSEKQNPKTKNKGITRRVEIIGHQAGTN